MSAPSGRPTKPAIQIELLEVDSRAWRAVALLAAVVALVCGVVPLVAGVSGSTALLAAIPMGVLVVGLTSATVPKNSAVIENGALTVRAGALFRKTVDVAVLDLDTVELVYPPRKLRELVGFRLFGVALPPYAAGWFTSRDPAVRRAFVCAPGPSPLMRIRAGNIELILGVKNPQQALAKLRDALAA